MARRWYPEFFYQPSRPRAARGGIKAQTKRGGFGQSWWAKRWIGVLENFDIDARLGRGRSYARSGQVLDLRVAEGHVTARVQGSRPQPYGVSIKVKTLTKGHWEKLAGALGNQAIFAAKLLTGEMPENIEEAFKTAGLSLFPEKSRDLETDCTCPDWSKPCKHIAAVYYLLGEEFDHDPFLIFKLRGMDRKRFVELLGAGGAKPPKKTRVPEAPSSVPLSAEPEAFWGLAASTDFDLGEVSIPPVSATLVKRLGNFPLWRAEEGLLQALQPLYAAAAPAGLKVVLGEPPQREAGSPDGMK